MSEGKTQRLAFCVDLGTTYSCAAIMRNGNVEVVANDQGNRTTPSYVSFSREERLIGEAAKNQCAVNPECTIFDAKRLIGRRFDDPVVQADMKLWPFKVINVEGKPAFEVQYKGETRTFRPEEIGAMVLSKMKDSMTAYVGQELKDVVITCPAYFNESQRNSTRDAGIIAGLNVLRIINEPTAAALAYGLQKNITKETQVCIIDLGGGTYDVSILCIENGLFEVKAVGGDTHLGGEDFDNRLVQHFAKEFQRKHHLDIAKDGRALRRLKTVSERAKRTLSAAPDADVEVDSLYQGIDFQSKITRAKFEDLCGDLFRQIVRPMEQCLADAKLSKSQIDEVVLVGGSTRIPKIQQLVKDFFNGKEPCKSVSVDEAVAVGGCVLAATLTGQDNPGTDGFLVLDIAPLTLGVETQGRIMAPVVPRGTAIPTKKSQIFSTARDGQPAVTIAIYEGERPLTKDNNLLGTFDLTGIPPAPRGVPQIHVTLDISPDGILTVAAEEKAGGKSHKITIDNHNSRLTREQIERMVKDAEAHKKEDEVVAHRIKARSSLEATVQNLRQTLETQGQQLDATDQAKVASLLDEETKWLEANDSAEPDTFVARQKELEKSAYSLMAKIHGEGQPWNREYGAAPESSNSSPKGPRVEEVD